ncbi:gamma-glutamyl-gamma-aminobutyrate hydrolase family protein [Sphaerisporangium sp. NPDC051011]|uniref:gamma-glutamyl-gamma-aminobutyrate hydrolase family protein n=1 Tax=Sphaerisporangium sp. NPDC051011 TaxID=3155792 RepID=UPI0033EF981D
MALTPCAPPVRIGVSCGTQVQETSFGPAPTVSLNMRYPHAVARAGGLPLVLPPTQADPAAVVRTLDGLVLTGGGDLDPACYGQEPQAEVYGVNRERDRFELALLAAAEARRIPVLGICRGLQLINISRGGDLLQHVEESLGHWQTGPSHEGAHRVVVTPGSRLAAMVGPEDLLVNSYHHQAINRLGEGLRVVAHAGGLPEACETDDGLVLGVQWHPEQMADDHERQLAIFRAFVDLARDRSLAITTHALR